MLGQEELVPQLELHLTEESWLWQHVLDVTMKQHRDLVLELLSWEAEGRLLLHGIRGLIDFDSSEIVMEGSDWTLVGGSKEDLLNSASARARMLLLVTGLNS